MTDLNEIIKSIRKSNDKLHTNPTLTKIAEHPEIGIIHCDIEGSVEGIYYIYLFNEQRIASPGFTSLTLLYDENSQPFFEFKDKVSSTISVESAITPQEPLTTTIIGFIRPDGTMHESIYDEYFNLERSSSFNKSKDFEDYYSLKEFISHKLDKKAQEENERLRSIRRNIESFNTKAKTLNYGKKN